MDMCGSFVRLSSIDYMRMGNKRKANLSGFISVFVDFKRDLVLFCSHSIVSWIMFHFGKSECFHYWRDVVCESSA